MNSRCCIVEGHDPLAAAVVELCVVLRVWRHQDVRGEEGDEQEVQGQLEVVDVAAEILPLVPHQAKAQGVAEEVLMVKRTKK